MGDFGTKTGQSKYLNSLNVGLSNTDPQVVSIPADPSSYARESVILKEILVESKRPFSNVSAQAQNWIGVKTSLSYAASRIKRIN